MDIVHVTDVSTLEVLQVELIILRLSLQQVVVTTLYVQVVFIGAAQESVTVAQVVHPM